VLPPVLLLVDPPLAPPELVVVLVLAPALPPELLTLDAPPLAFPPELDTPPLAEPPELDAPPLAEPPELLDAPPLAEPPELDAPPLPEPPPPPELLLHAPAIRAKYNGKCVSAEKRRLRSKLRLLLIIWNPPVYSVKLLVLPTVRTQAELGISPNRSGEPGVTISLNRKPAKPSSRY
jgi:hypothetical protein